MNRYTAASCCMVRCKAFEICFTTHSQLFVASHIINQSPTMITTGGRLQAEKHRVALRCTLRSTARRRLQNQGQRAPGPRSACPRLTLRSLSSRSNGGGLCRCSSRSSHELAIGSFPRRIYNGSRKFLFQPLMNLLHALIWRENQRAMHLRSDFGRSTT